MVATDSTKAGVGKVCFMAAVCPDMFSHTVNPPVADSKSCSQHVCLIHRTG